MRSPPYSLSKCKSNKSLHFPRSPLPLDPAPASHSASGRHPNSGSLWIRLHSYQHLRSLFLSFLNHSPHLTSIIFLLIPIFNPIPSFQNPELYSSSVIPQNPEPLLSLVLSTYITFLKCLSLDLAWGREDPVFVFIEPPSHCFTHKKCLTSWTGNKRVFRKEKPIKVSNLLELQNSLKKTKFQVQYINLVELIYVIIYKTIIDNLLYFPIFLLLCF